MKNIVSITITIVFVLVLFWVLNSLVEYKRIELLPMHVNVFETRERKTTNVVYKFEINNRQENYNKWVTTNRWFQDSAISMIENAKEGSYFRKFKRYSDDFGDSTDVLFDLSDGTARYVIVTALQKDKRGCVIFNFDYEQLVKEPTTMGGRILGEATGFCNISGQLGFSTLSFSEYLITKLRTTLSDFSLNRDRLYMKRHNDSDGEISAELIALLVKQERKYGDVSVSDSDVSISELEVVGDDSVAFVTFMYMKGNDGKRRVYGSVFFTDKGLLVSLGRNKGLENYFIGFYP